MYKIDKRLFYKAQILTNHTISKNIMLQMMIRAVMENKPENGIWSKYTRMGAIIYNFKYGGLGRLH